MKKKFLFVILVLCSLFFITGCNGIESIFPPFGNEEEENIEDLKQIYNLAVKQGYDGTYEEWLELVKGDKVEIRSADGFIQWRYSKDSEWLNLIPLDELMGENGLSPHIGENGNWFIGDQDTGVSATEKGENGLTPYIGSNGNWWIGDVDTGKSATSKGEDGLTPYIGTNGNWFIGDKDTGVSANSKGENGLTPYIGSNGNWFIGDKDTGVSATEKGDNGLTPHIGDNGNWFLGDTDTGVSATEKGDNGLTPYIGANGNWWIGDTDTGASVTGKGENGKSAYELFIEKHPEYKGDESQWLDDLLNNRLSDSNYKYYEATFEDGSGNVLSTQKVLASHLLEKPENPKKAGFIFTGWFVDGEKWNFDANVLMNNTTLVANWVRSTITPTVYFTFVSSDKDSIYFDLHIDDVSTIESIVVYKEGELIHTLPSVNDREFKNLLSNTEYRIEVTYSYDLNDGFGRQYQKFDRMIKTYAKDKPSLYFENIQTTLNSITFDLVENDYDNICTVDRVELLQGTKVISTITDLSNKTFSNLYSGVQYTLKAYYKYDLNEGMGEENQFVECEATTEKLIKPVVTINNVSSTQNTINAEVIVSDPSKINKIASIELYEGKTLVSSQSELLLAFSNLKNNTTYTLVVKFKYDLNNGLGIVDDEVRQDIVTHPAYQLLNTSILNTSAIVEGDMVYIYAQVVNPSNAMFTKIVINGVEYPVDPASTTTNIYTSISSVAVGSTEFVIEKMIAELNGTEFEYYAENNNKATAELYERMYVKSIEFVNEALEPIDYAFQSDKVYIKINLDNPNNYDLIYASIGATEYGQDKLIKHDNNTYYVFYDDTSDGNYSLTLNSFEYSNELIQKKTFTDVNMEKFMTRLYDDKIYEIKTIDDLKNIENNHDYWNDYYYYYKLMNDLDFSGVEWNPVNMYGVFDGNGHKIKNVKYSKTYENTSIRLGIFNNASGMIKDLDIESMVIMVDAKSTTGYNYDIHVGGFVSYAITLKLYNCHTDNNSSISIQNEFKYYQHSVGGLIGYGSHAILENCGNRANINGKNIESCSGLIGSQYNYSSFTNCYNTGNITGTSLFTSENYGGKTNADINNCYNTGLLNGKYSNNFGVYKEYIKNSISLGETYTNKELNWIDKTITFETSTSEKLPTIIGKVIDELPKPIKEGYRFAGWYDNKELAGEKIKTPYYIENDITLYAKWDKLVEDTSSIVINDKENPFIEQDNIISSTVHTKGDYTSAKYKIVADKKLNIYFEYNIKYASERYSIYKLDINGNSTVIANDDYDRIDEDILVELNEGESLVFFVDTTYHGDIILNIKDLAICYGK